MINIGLQNVNLRVQDFPTGEKVIICEDPQSGINVLIPLGEGAVKFLRDALGGVAVASPADLAQLKLA